MFTAELIGMAFRLSSVPMLLVSPSGEIVLANDELLELFGYAEGELSGRKVEILVPESVRGAHAQYVEVFMQIPTKRVMGKGRVMTGISKSGATIPLELALNSVEIDGQVHSVVAAFDISMQIAHQAKLTQAMEAATSAMIMVDERGQIVLVNAAAEDLSGYERAELLGQPIEVLVPEDTRLPHRVYRANYAVQPDKRNMTRGRDIHLAAKGGGSIPVEVTLAPVSTPEGEMVMCTAIDLRERLAVEKVIRDKNAELTQFTYSVSHDLKAPLASILGLLLLLREDVDDGVTEGMADTLDRVIALCRRHSGKIERVLNISSNTEVEEAQAIELAAMIGEIWESVEPGAGVEAKLDLQLQVGTLTSGQIGVEIILHNLLSNAVKYHDPEKPLAEVCVTSKSVEGGMVELCVSDNGVGIPAEHQNSVFDIFRRIDSRGGDGIGLALVKKHVARLGGEVELESEPGKGTSFRVRLPDRKG